jgi:hypothetical protein
LLISTGIVLLAPTSAGTIPDLSPAIVGGDDEAVVTLATPAQEGGRVTDGGTVELPGRSAVFVVGEPATPTGNVCE